MRILNISFWTQEQDVEKFFDQWTLVPGSVKFKLDLRTGVKIGECAVVFDDINDVVKNDVDVGVSDVTNGALLATFRSNRDDLKADVIFGFCKY